MYAPQRHIHTETRKLKERQRHFSRARTQIRFHYCTRGHTAAVASFMLGTKSNEGRRIKRNKIVKETTILTLDSFN